MNWLVVGGEYAELRYQTLSEFLNAEGIENQLDIISVETAEFLSTVQEATKKYDQIRIERPYTDKIVHQLTHQSTLARSIGAADSYQKKAGGWWPTNVLAEGLGRLASHRFHKLDLTASVFVVGTGGMARAAIAAFSKLGFQRINVTDRYTEKLQTFVQEMKRNFFKVNIEYTTFENLTLLPGNHQVLVNTTPLTLSNQLLDELYYFNYMRSEGIVIDLTLVPVETPLLKEAQSVKAQAVPGFEVAAWTDSVWVEQCFGKKINVEKYTAFLKEKLEGVPFDLQPFVDRLK